MRSFFALNNINTRSGISVFLTVLLFTASINFLGCETKKEEKPVVVNVDSIKAVVAQQIADSIAMAQQIADSIAMAEKARVPDMMGKWTGALDGKATTLTITEQTENKFSGTIVINFRNVSNKTVSGTIDVENNKISMRDTQKFRYAGTYSGKLSDDKTKFSGTFTIPADNNNFSFSLTKK
ncbi:MAG: hypothetical protein K8H86_04880 [Ignavibacteriaceae bacterium]|nr:hypothetical protein [Ignavibacteriaceae bacterium]